VKGDANEFIAEGMNDTERARLTREPLVFEMHGNMLSSLVVNADNFGKGCSHVDDSKCMKAEFTGVRKSDLPNAATWSCRS
jgi:hypothetical protein